MEDREAEDGVDDGTNRSNGHTYYGVRRFRRRTQFCSAVWFPPATNACPWLPHFGVVQPQVQNGWNNSRFIIWLLVASMVIA